MFEIYQEWPEQTVRQALSDFKDQMYNDANAEQLSAGIRCFEFLCRRSDLPESLRLFIGAAVDEAQTRITLMRMQERADEDFSKTLDRWKGQLQSINRTTKNILNLRADPDTVQHYVRQRVAER